MLIPGAAAPVHGIERELPLTEQLLGPHCSIFSQSPGLSGKVINKEDFQEATTKQATKGKRILQNSGST